MRSMMGVGAVARLLVVMAVVGLLLIGALAAPVGEAAAAGLAPAVADEVVPPQAPADEGGAGLSNAGASEWLPFAITLGPFLVLITGLLWLTFGIDRSEKKE